MLFGVTVALGLLSGLVSGQIASNSSMVDPAIVPATFRSQWCQGQQNTCGTLCSGDTSDNECDPNSLEYSCICKSNSSSPGLQYYKETMPTFMCEMIFQNCIKAGENSQAAQDLCTANERKNCGQLNPADFSPEPPSGSSKTPSASAPTTETGASASSTTASGAATTMVSSRHFGTGALAIGLIAALGLIP